MLYWAPFSFSLELRLNPSYSLLSQVPTPLSSPQAINFLSQCIVLGSLQFFLRLHAKPLLPPIIPGFHPPIFPASNKRFMSVPCSHFITFYSRLYASLPPNIKPTYPYFFKQYDDFEMQINIGKGVNMARITTNLMIIVVVKNCFGL